MRNLLLLLFLSFHIAVYGKAVDSVLHRMNFQGNLAYFTPTGQFSAKYSNNYFLGQSKSGVGMNLTVLARVYKNLHVGVYLQVENFWLDRGRISDQLRQHFEEPGYYVSATVPTQSMTITTGGVEFSYKFRNPFGEIEPYLTIGIGGIAPGYTGAIIHRKKMNDNYSVDINIDVTPNSTFFYPGIGARFNKKIYKPFYFTCGLQYNYGITGYRLDYLTTDYLNTSSISSANYNQTVSSLQIQAGIQIRVGKAKRFRHK